MTHQLTPRRPVVSPAKTSSRRHDRLAARRAKHRSQAVPQHLHHGFLQRATVGRTTLVYYRRAVDAFRKWVRKHRSGADLVDVSYVDSLMAEYFSTCYFEGQNVALGRFMLYGWIHLNTIFDGSKHGNFPQATKALRGWARMAPQQVRDPMPYGLLCVILMEFLRLGHLGHVLMAAAAIVQFDTYMRRSEVMHLLREDLYPPAKAAGARYAKRWCVVIRPNKQGETDNTVEVGSFPRLWIANVLPHLRRCTAPHGRIFPFTLAQYEDAFKRVALSFGLGASARTPHCIRHSGPSHDMWSRHRGLHEIQQRGKWRSLKSVQRYEKHGALLRQLSMLSEDSLSRLPIAERELTRALPKALARLRPNLTKSFCCASRPLWATYGRVVFLLLPQHLSSFGAQAESGALRASVKLWSGGDNLSDHVRVEMCEMPTSHRKKDRARSPALAWPVHLATG